jgi:hypothetical protein
MFKKSKNNVRDHSEEREWLTNLGEGNLVAGVQFLVRQLAEQKAAQDAEKGKRGK